MGAILKEDRINGKTLKSAFRSLQEIDREELGNDYYSGGWNNAQGIVEVDADTFNNDEPGKHEPAWALCVQKPIENTNANKSTVIDYPAKGTRKWTTQYQVKHPIHGNVCISEDKKGDAVKKAREMVSKDPDLSPLNVEIVKVLDGKTVVSEVQYKPSSRERDGIWEIKGCLSY